MSILSDRQLRELGPQLIQPFRTDMVQPASIDVHIDRYVRIAENGKWGVWADPSTNSDQCFSDQIDIKEGQVHLMEPGQFVLASTFEYLTIPPNMVARFEGKSSLARLGLLTHVTAGFIDPGFEGYVTLELKNLLPINFVITPGMKIGQICFEMLSEDAECPYGHIRNGSHYQTAHRGPTLNRSHHNFRTINVYEKKEEVMRDSSRDFESSSYV